MQRNFDKTVLLGHVVAILPLAIWVSVGFLPDHFNYNNDLAGYTGPGQVIHGGKWMFPWSMPICLIGGIAGVVMGCRGRKTATLCEGLWCCLAAGVFFWAYPLYVHFV